MTAVQLRVETWSRSRTLLLAVGAHGAAACVAVRAVGLRPALLAYLVFGAVLVHLTWVDVRELRLPNRITGFASLGAVPLLGLAAVSSPPGSSLGRALGGSLFSGGCYLVFRLFSPRQFGLGDVKLAPLLGAHLGFVSMPALGLGLLAPFLLNGAFSAALLVSRRANAKTKVPFGPSMALGALVALAVHGVGP